MEIKIGDKFLYISQTKKYTILCEAHEPHEECWIFKTIKIFKGTNYTVDAYSEPVPKSAIERDFTKLTNCDENILQELYGN